LNLSQLILRSKFCYLIAR